MLKALLFIFFLLASTVLAHKSVRHRRPATELEREEHHSFHLNHPHNHHHEAEPSGPVRKHHPDRAVYRSPRYHLRYGPSYPKSLLTPHYPEPRFDKHGQLGDEVPEGKTRDQMHPILEGDDAREKE